MPFPTWITTNWYSLVEASGIIGGLVFTAVSFRTDAKARRTENLLELTKQQRGIWSELMHRPELKRVMETAPDLKAKPITMEEELFVRFLILHLNSAFQAIRNGMFASPEGLRGDVREFFSYPIPRAVWGEIKELQDKDFVEFVNFCQVV